MHYETCSEISGKPGRNRDSCMLCFKSKENSWLIKRKLIYMRRFYHSTTSVPFYLSPEEQMEYIIIIKQLLEDYSLYKNKKIEKLLKKTGRNKTWMSKTKMCIDRQTKIPFQRETHSKQTADYQEIFLRLRKCRLCSCYIHTDLAQLSSSRY
jgi:hypothetical protein